MNNRIWYLVMILIVGAFAVAVVNDVTYRAPVSVPEIENPGKAMPLPPTAEGQAILDAIKEAGYPPADKMSDELKARIIAAVNSGELKTIDEDTPGSPPGVSYTLSAKLVGFSTSDQCADQDVCLVVITNDKGTFVSYVMDNRRDPSSGTSQMYGLGGFFGGDKYLITALTPLGEHSCETGYAITISTGVAAPIAEMCIGPADDGMFVGLVASTMQYKDYSIDLFVSQSENGTDVVGTHELSFNVKKGAHGIYKQTDFVREIDDKTMAGDPMTNQMVAIDYVRTFTYATPALPNNTDPGDPLRGTMKFHGEGLYMWILGGLYYFDPATGTIGLDLSQSP